jgi:hypothetical protein
MSQSFRANIVSLTIVRLQRLVSLENFLLVLFFESFLPYCDDIVRVLLIHLGLVLLLVSMVVLTTFLFSFCSCFANYSVLALQRWAV